MKSVLYILGWILNIEALFMLLPIGTAIIYRENEGIWFALAMAILAVLGLLLTWKKPKAMRFYVREGFVCTALGWIALSFFGCLPFVWTGEIPRLIDALFETVSGFTTTGASILPQVEFMSHCSMLWRCFTHWIGGMGVLVFLLAVLPMVGGSNMQLMKAESPGPSVGKLVPKVRTTAMMLYRLYIILTIAEAVLLILAGMIPFEAVCTALGTAGTGGFGFRNDSFMSFSPAIQWIVAVFMMLFGVNFNVYYLLQLGRLREASRCEEMRWYLGIITAATLLITANLASAGMHMLDTVRHAYFQVCTVMTTTGFSSADFDLWPGFSRALLVFLMYVGACAGSTGGGLKISRIVIAVKALLSYLGGFLHPHAVRRVRFEGKDVEPSTLFGIYIYFIGAFVIVAASILIVSLDNKDLVTTFTAVTATFNNIGPGLAKVGPTQHYAHFSTLSKAVMIFDMLAGRLEIFPMLLLFYPPLWRETVGDNLRRLRRKRRTREADSVA
ncbi:MAG: TrkH family potassium uptake protein [Clostridia bacterium]|nr:TrkH family potassium uptake protein [Clostridia bacterium]